MALYVAKLRMTYEYKSKDRLKSTLEADAKKELELTRLVANLEEEWTPLGREEASWTGVTSWERGNAGGVVNRVNASI